MKAFVPSLTGTFSDPQAEGLDSRESITSNMFGAWAAWAHGHAGEPQTVT